MDTLDSLKEGSEMLPWILVLVLAAIVAYALIKNPKTFLRVQRTKKCINCTHWDQEAGQAQLRRNPTFAAVMMVLTPNDELGKQVKEDVTDTDENGNVTVRKVVKRLPIYPVLENRWEYFGGCMQDHMLRHRTDTCEKFEAKA